MTRRTRTDRRVIVTRVTFEVGRLSTAGMIDAYERAVPIARRRSRDERLGPRAQVSQRQRSGEERG